MAMFKIQSKTQLGSKKLQTNNAPLKIQSKTSFDAPSRTLLQGITVKNRDGVPIQVSDFWGKQTVILKVLRRFGCALCRYESRLLSELKLEFDELDVRLIAIGCEEIGFDEFLYGGYWDWDLYIDEEHSVYTALGLNRVTVGAALKDTMSITTRIALAAAQAMGIQNDIKGDTQQLGGTFVIQKGTGQMLYEMRQNSASNFCSLKELFEACGGDPDIIDEKAPGECTVFRKHYSSDD